MIVEAFIDGLIDDAILVPVSVNYEKLVDGNFTNEQMGTPKRQESFRNAMSSIWKILNSKFGLMRIDFNEPFSLKELVKSFKERQIAVVPTLPNARKLMTGPSATSMYGIEVIDKHRVLVDNIARHLVFDSSCATTVMSTNIVAFLLLHRFRRGATMKELSLVLTELRQQIGTERDCSFEGESEKVIARAVKLLGSPLVKQTVQPNGELFIEAVLNVPSVIETAYYGNTFVPYFALDAVVVTALATIEDGAAMLMADIVDNAMLYCDILRYEFIFYKPCQDFAEQIEKTVNRLCKFGVVTKAAVGDGVTLNTESSGMLLSALAPFSVAYYTTAQSLMKLLDEQTMLEADFVKDCLHHLLHKFNTGGTNYGESISTDSIKNCMKLMEKWTVTEATIQNGARLMSLSSAFNSPAGVQDVIEKIEKFVILK